MDEDVTLPAPSQLSADLAKVRFFTARRPISPGYSEFALFGRDEITGEHLLGGEPMASVLVIGEISDERASSLNQKLYRLAAEALALPALEDCALTLGKPPPAEMSQ